MKRRLVQSQLNGWLSGTARARVYEREPAAQPGLPEVAEPPKPESAPDAEPARLGGR